MAITNAERVGKALDFLNEGIVPFVEREMQSVHGKDWMKKAKDCFASGQKTSLDEKPPRWDSYAVLTVMNNQWALVFGNTLGKSDRNLVIELQDVRNRWAHQENFSSDDCYRALDSVHRLLTSVSAAKEANEVNRMRQDLLRTRFAEEARTEQRRAAAMAIEGTPQTGLKPWREIVTPHPDVASGRYQQAEFAADLSQVHRNEGADEYRDATQFYARTFITDGLKDLLVNAVRRLGGKGGDPIVELQTNFGGGKTHSMLALYHLVSGRTAAELPGIEVVLQEAALPQPPLARKAVLVGTAASPAQPQTKEDGTTVRTFWGDLAWQLMGKDGYKMVQKADKEGVSPGSDVLRHIFKSCAPCLILIDEWVAYIRQLYGKKDLAGGSFEANLSFAQALTEAARAVPDALVVASLPSSDIEIGGEAGKEALTILKNTFGRMQSPWRPASAEESFEIVRRRLFQSVEPENFAARDNVIKAYSKMYQDQVSEFPSHCREGEYARRMANAYPVHPELFDRLYEDWSSMEQFQRTRGVLRLMASVIHSLWERNDSGLMILPSAVPVDDPSVQFELTRYLPEPWVPVIEKDIDGPNSLPLRLDRENPNLGRYSACRRVSRTLYLGSAPTSQTAHKGLEDRSIKLGCAQPGESVPIFGDALRRLTDQATHLYVDGKRYWYSTQPSVTRLAQDRATQVDLHDVHAEIEKRLRKDSAYRGDFNKVHACPTASSDIPDERECRLVILRPECVHSSNVDNSPARLAVAEMLEKHGNGPRHYRNTLVFVAADKTRLSDLEQAIRNHIAWLSIERDKENLNLDEFQRNLARTKLSEADETIKQRIPETFVWLLYPTQTTPTDKVGWEQIRLQGQDAIAVKASRKLKNDGVLVANMAGVALKLEMDRIPLWRGDHVEVRQLVDDFAQYPYLPKVASPGVVLQAIQDGIHLMTWMQDTFAYADGWDDKQKRYLGLKAGGLTSVVSEGGSVVVRSLVAVKQLEQERAPEPTGPTGGGYPTGDGGKSSGGAGGTTVREPVAPEVKKLRRFHGSVSVQPLRLGRQAGEIAEEVVQHLTALMGTDVSVSIEITATCPDGFPENVVRTVSENSRTLKFTSQGFEEQ
ncbi:MAG: DUF499 domain-containing protein [Candidatus Hydrogenedentes bacterium]|nr:DUF499 domain-containing protein [Candidatus Hydrogenedentota bacterium]